MGSAVGGTSANPTITSLALIYGTDDALTVPGTNFGSSQGSSTVTVNGAAAFPSSWSSTSIVTAMPFGGPTVNPITVVVTVGGTSSNDVTISAQPGPLSSPWLDQDVGSVGTAGNANYLDDIFTLNGGGVARSSIHLGKRK